MKIKFEECSLKIVFEEFNLKIEFEERSLKIGLVEALTVVVQLLEYPPQLHSPKKMFYQIDFSTLGHPSKKVLSKCGMRVEYLNNHGN